MVCEFDSSKSEVQAYKLDHKRQYVYLRHGPSSSLIFYLRLSQPLLQSCFIETFELAELNKLL